MLTATKPTRVRVSLSAMLRRTSLSSARIRPPTLARPSPVALEAVAHPGHGADPLPLRAELLPQPAHVHVHRARLDLPRRGVAPHVVEEVLAREYAAPR